MTAKQDETLSYQPPSIRVMDEKEILKVFQITSAATSWWHG